MVGGRLEVLRSKADLVLLQEGVGVLEFTGQLGANFEGSRALRYA